MTVAPSLSRPSTPAASVGAVTWLLRGVGAVIGFGVLWAFRAIVEHFFNEYAVQILTFALINVVLAVSLNLINGIAGQFSLGHAGFMAIGAYVSAFFTRDIGPRFLPFVDPVIFAISLGLAALAAGLAGLLVGLPSLRLRGDYLAIVTLGFGQIITSILRNLFFGKGTISTNAGGGGTSFINDVPRNTDLLWAGGAAILCILTVRNIANSNLGRAMRAVREDEVAAEAAGVDTTRAKIMAFVISAMWAGIAGGLFVGVQQIAEPESYTFVRSVEIVVMVVLGGLGSITGVTISALLLTGLQEALHSTLAAFIAALCLVVLAAILSLPRYRSPENRTAAWVIVWLRWPVVSLIALTLLWVKARPLLEARADALRYVLYALILIVLMLLRPQGLLGRAELSFGALRRRRASAPGRPAEPVDAGVSGAL